MRAVWIDAGNNPVSGLLKRYGITRCLWPSHVEVTHDDGSKTFEPNLALTYDYLEGWRKGFEVGVYGAASWFGHEVVTLARELDATLSRLNQRTRQCTVHANIEHGDALGDLPLAVVRFVTEWRALRPLRETTWVVDGLQGGLFATTLLMTLRYYDVSVMAEAFTGAMAPLSPDDVRSNLVNFGIPRDKALVMYDAATLKQFTFWDGCAFTQGRLA
jgi:hypothetical protein